MRANSAVSVASLWRFTSRLRGFTNELDTSLFPRWEATAFQTAAQKRFNNRRFDQ
jgi:hypothetical protein